MKKTIKCILSILIILVLFFPRSSVFAANSLSTPKNLKGKISIVDGTTYLNINWDKVKGCEGYEVYYRSQIPGDEYGTWEEWSLIEKTKNTKSVGCIVDGLFQMRVRAYKGNQYSSYTKIITVLGGDGITTLTPRLDKTKLSLKVGKSAQLHVIDSTDDIKWTSSNSKTVTVKNGKVTAKKSGTAIITAKMGKTRLKCSVTVKKTTSGSSIEDTLNTYLKKMQKDGGIYSFEIIDLNFDGKKDLVINDNSGSSSSDWYSIVYVNYGGKLIKNKLTSNLISFNKTYCNVGGYTSSTSYFYKISKGKFVKHTELQEKIDFARDQERSYYINNTKVSEKKYQSVYSSYTKTAKFIRTEKLTEEAVKAFFN